MDKKFVWIFVLIGITTFATAAWFFAIQVNINATVISIPGYATLAVNIPSLSVNTTDEADSSITFAQVLINKDIILNVSIVELYQDDSGGQCDGGLRDCTMRYMIQNNNSNDYMELIDEQSISLHAMNIRRNITVEMSCDAYSCPQSRSTEIILTEIQ